MELDHKKKEALKLKQDKTNTTKQSISFEPKFIRGPTKKPGGFRHIGTDRFQHVETEGFSAKGKKPNGFRSVATALTEEEEISNVAFPSEQQGAQLTQAFESDSADLQFGRVSGKVASELKLTSAEGKNKSQTVLVSSRKNEDQLLANTYKKKVVQLSRARHLFKRSHNTISERMDHAFCHFIPVGTQGEAFLRYLEEASRQAETEELKEVFPFLETKSLQEKLSQLNTQRIKLQGNAENPGFNDKLPQVKAIDEQIDQVRIQIYDHQLKKIQFKKRLDLAIKTTEAGAEETSDETFWFLQWLKKILEALIADGEAPWNQKDSDNPNSSS